MQGSLTATKYNAIHVPRPAVRQQLLIHAVNLRTLNRERIVLAVTVRVSYVRYDTIR